MHKILITIEQDINQKMDIVDLQYIKTLLYPTQKKQDELILKGFTLQFTF